MTRVGYGFDCHAFADGDHLVVGNVRIPHTNGVRAHSDGDALIHALCDALLGACAQGDIGEHFPDSDPRYCDQDSAYFLRACLAIVRSAGYRLVNVDSTVILERPRLSPHKAAIRARLAHLLGLDEVAVSVKATTAEGMGAIGAGAGWAAHCVVLLEGVEQLEDDER